MFLRHYLVHCYSISLSVLLLCIHSFCVRPTISVPCQFMPTFSTTTSPTFLSAIEELSSTGQGEVQRSSRTGRGRKRTVDVGTRRDSPSLGTAVGCKDSAEDGHSLAAQLQPFFRSPKTDLARLWVLFAVLIRQLFWGCMGAAYAKSRGVDQRYHDLLMILSALTAAASMRDKISVFYMLMNRISRNCRPTPLHLEKTLLEPYGIPVALLRH
jgi:hypothetical protein